MIKKYIYIHIYPPTQLSVSPSTHVSINMILAKQKVAARKEGRKHAQALCRAQTNKRNEMNDHFFKSKKTATSDKTRKVEAESEKKGRRKGGRKDKQPSISKERKTEPLQNRRLYDQQTTTDISHRSAMSSITT